MRTATVTIGDDDSVRVDFRPGISVTYPPDHEAGLALTEVLTRAAGDAGSIAAKAAAESILHAAEDAVRVLWGDE